MHLMSILQAMTRKLEKLRKIRANRNIISYLICVVIASILWFLNVLNKDYDAELNYPIKYTNFPEGKYPVIKPPSQIRLEVKAKGFALLGHRIRTSFLPVTLNFGSYSSHLQRKGNIYEYTLNTGDIKDKIANQLSSFIKLLNIYPEEIVFRFADAKRKKIAVRPALDYSLKRQYILNRVITTPDSVWVNGPSPVIDTLQHVTTQPLQIKNINRDLKRKLDLVAVSGCSIAEESVEVQLEVEQFTESSKTIPITALSVPDSMNIQLFPPQVNIRYEIGLSKYDQVSDEDFIFSVSYPQNPDITYLEVKPSKVPPFIKNLSYSPQKVEFILEKR